MSGKAVREQGCSSLMSSNEPLPTTPPHHRVSGDHIRSLDFLAIMVVSSTFSSGGCVRGDPKESKDFHHCPVVIRPHYTSLIPMEAIWIAIKAVVCLLARVTLAGVYCGAEIPTPPIHDKEAFFSSIINGSWMGREELKKKILKDILAENIPNFA